jgi:hypothetical protein
MKTEIIIDPEKLPSMTFLFYSCKQIIKVEIL